MCACMCVNVQRNLLWKLSTRSTSSSRFYCISLRHVHYTYSSIKDVATESYTAKP